MFRWSQIPLIRLIIPFIIGILAQPHLNLSTLWLSLSFIVLGLLSLITSKVTISYRYRSLVGLFYFIVLFIGGVVCSQFYNKSPDSTLEKLGSYYAQVIEHPEEKEKSLLLSLKLIGLNNQFSEEQILAYLEKDALAKQIQVGDFILFKGTSALISKKRNPGTFDYAKYLAKKNIYHQVYLQSGSWRITDSKVGFYPIIWSKRIQRYIRLLFDRYLTNNSAKSILYALVLGDKSELDDDLSNQFAVAGAMHVLAVSGLHVGIIYKVLEAIILLLFSKKSFNQVRVVLLISFLWIYAFITGLSPSVLRAVFMFTFIIVAKARMDRPNFYNTLAASAFIILIVWPNYIYHVGFQLSYSAVLAIVSIYPLLYPYVVTKNKFINSVTSLLIVSIAAQIGTAPFAIYYFHQFPTYFIITNLIAIPAAFLLLSGGLLLIPFHFISTDMAKFFGLIIDWIGQVLSSLISWISKLPNANLNQLWIDQVQLLSLYVFLSILIYTASNFWKKGVYITFLVLIFSLYYTLNLKLEQNRQELIVLYSVNNATVFSFIKGTNAFVYSSRDSIFTTADWNYQIKPSLDSLGIINIHFNSTSFPWVSYLKHGTNDLFQLEDKVVVIRNDTALDHLIKKHKNVFVVENNLELTEIEILPNRHFVTSSVTWWEINNLEGNSQMASIRKLYNKGIIVH